MLYIYRRRGEGVQIGTDIHIEVMRMKNGEVQLGITAPKETAILRSELLERDNIPPAPRRKGASEYVGAAD